MRGFGNAWALCALFLTLAIVISMGDYFGRLLSLGFIRNFEMDVEMSLIFVSSTIWVYMTETKFPASDSPLGWFKMQVAASCLLQRGPEWCTAEKRIHTPYVCTIKRWKKSQEVEKVEEEEEAGTEEGP